jgi:hypothetical protein
MKISTITRLFVEDIHAKHDRANEAGSSFVRIPTKHLGALLELLCELEMAAGQASRPKPGHDDRPRGSTAKVVRLDDGQTITVDV